MHDGPGEDGQGLLAGVRVLDLADGSAAAVSRLLADLGADVLKVEPPGGSPARMQPPLLAGVSIPFALHNANKRSVLLDPAVAADHRRFVELAGTADIVIDSGRPGRAAAYGTSCNELADRYPSLVSMQITDFGATGPRASWQATDAVLYALSGALSRSGPTVGTPVLPPDGVASATAAVQATWAALVGYYNRLRCGHGDYIDFSRFDAVVTGLDPVFGSHGQAAAAQRGPSRWRGRPKNQDAYPIYRCWDGYVRLCVMAPRQWHGLRAWLGEPDEYQDRRFDVIAERFAAWPRIGLLVEELFADQTMAELVSAGQARGVPIAAVADPARVPACDHFEAVGAFTRASLGTGVTATVPVGYYRVDGRRSGWRTAAPEAATAGLGWQTRTRFAPPPRAAAGRPPFEGLRIVDLGVIVAGGEATRLFADLGAEVIKVESKSHPDGLRQTRAGAAISESFAWTHRNKLGFGLELRSPDGQAVFGRLVAAADAVFANFKPGTLAALGFSGEAWRGLNDRLVLAESSAYGDRGPWSSQMGYGPLVRAAAGVTRLWTAPDDTATPARHPFYDATTVFPDHVVARVTAIGALAALIRRDRTGRGARIHVSQAEVVINQLDTGYVARAATGPVRPATGVDVVCPCLGDDEWCVISVRDDPDWAAAATAFANPEAVDDARFGTGAARLRHRGELTEILSRYTRMHSASRVAETLQVAGVPAAPMNRPPDVADDPQLGHRKLFSAMTHPLIDGVLPAETGPAPYRNIPPAAQRPAPLAGQDTRTVCAEVLAMTATDTERLIAGGVLFATGR